MPPHWLVFYCDICKVFLKYFFFIYGTLNLTFFTLHYITTTEHGALDDRCRFTRAMIHLFTEFQLRAINANYTELFSCCRT